VTRHGEYRLALVELPDEALGGLSSARQVVLDDGGPQVGVGLVMDFGVLLVDIRLVTLLFAAKVPPLRIRRISNLPTRDSSCVERRRLPPATPADRSTARSRARAPRTSHRHESGTHCANLLRDNLARNGCRTTPQHALHAPHHLHAVHVAPDLTDAMTKTTPVSLKKIKRQD